MGTRGGLLWRLLYRGIFCADLSGEGFCADGHPVGGCVCVGDRIYRDVADGKEEGGKLVLVDRDEYRFDPFIFRQTLCVHQCILSGPADHGGVGAVRVEQTRKNGKICRLERSSLSGRSLPASPLSLRLWLRIFIRIGCGSMRGNTWRNM